MIVDELFMSNIKNDGEPYFKLISRDNPSIWGTIEKEIEPKSKKDIYVIKYYWNDNFQGTAYENELEKAKERLKHILKEMFDKIKNMKYIQTYENFIYRLYKTNYHDNNDASLNLLLLEFNREDKRILMSPDINHTFTISFEFELECDDPKYVPKEDLNVDDIKNIEKEFVNRSIKYGVYDKKSVDYLINLIDLSDLDYTFEILDKPSVVKKINDDLLFILIDLLNEYEEMKEKENRDDDTNILKYGIKMIKKHFPNFYKKWYRRLKFVLDDTLRRGIEISLKTYIVGLDNAIQFIHDFYDDFEKQNYWYQDYTTSIHINIGFTKPVKWNITKGLIMLGEIENKDKKDSIPFIYRNIESRMETDFTKSLLKLIRSELKESVIKNNIKNLKDIETELEKIAMNKIKLLGPKAFSVNIDRIKNNNYVEFRHVGGKVTRQVLIDKLLYLSYIAYLMTTNYRQFDYHKKLYKYVFGD